MFYYFGYGSNINLISLKAKGVIPVSSEKAVLKDWKLRFNVQHWFTHEGGMGNIEPSTDSGNWVEGMIHLCPEEHLPSLDAMESEGVAYKRIEIEVETENGPKKALTYIGMPAFINEECLPTRRYLNIILKGAIQAGLSKDYLAKLQNQALRPEETYPDFVPQEGDNLDFNSESILPHKNLTALAGHVFDMSKARRNLQVITPLFGGKDMTLFHIKRHDSSNGNEQIEDFLNDRLSPAVKNYLNGYLDAYQKEFEYVGKYKF